MKYVDLHSVDWPPPSWAQMYRALLHQDSITYCRMQMYPVPIDCLPAKWAQLYRALLHQDSITFWSMLMYTVPIDTLKSSPIVQSPTTPGQYYILQNADVPSANWPSSLSMKPNITESYYTRSGLHIEQCIELIFSDDVYRQIKCSPQYYILQNADIPSVNWPPSLIIEPNCTEPCYTRSVLHMEQWGEVIFSDDIYR